MADEIMIVSILEGLSFTQSNLNMKSHTYEQIT